MTDRFRYVVELVRPLFLPQPDHGPKLPLLRRVELVELAQQFLWRHAASAFTFFLAAATSRRRTISALRCSGVIDDQNDFMATLPLLPSARATACVDFCRAAADFVRQPARFESLPFAVLWNFAQRWRCASEIAAIACGDRMRRGRTCSAAAEAPNASPAAEPRRSADIDSAPSSTNPPA